MNALEAADAVFRAALGRSAALALLTAGISLALGWPCGVAAGIWSFRGRVWLLALLALPLMLPSFLIAIGLSMLVPGLDGLAGAVAAHLCMGLPLVALAAGTATMGISRHQAEAVRLCGGERLLFRQAMRAALPLAALAAGMTGVMTLADPGPGQIFGHRGAAGQVLVSFAAQYDVALATRQCLWLALLALVFTLPMAWRLGPLLEARLGGRETATLRPVRRGAACALLAAACAVCVGLPVLGLCRPLLRAGVASWPAARAWSEVQRTWADTALYLALAAALAVGAGFSLAWLFAKWRRAVIMAALLLLAVPPALPALWLVPWSHELTTSAALALRGLPVAMLLGLRARGTMARSWGEAAAVHAVPSRVYLWKVTLPWLARWAGPAGGIAALLAAADVGTVLLLHPPGHGTLPLAIFTIMANASETLVAMLCLMYVALALALAALTLFLFRSR